MFDDGLIKSRAEYDANWEFPAGRAREWDVGYIRSASPQWDDKNSYGENLEDLYPHFALSPRSQTLFDETALRICGRPWPADR